MKITIGVDEVGYGAIAGPLVVAAVAFPVASRRPVLKREKRKPLPVKDSKCLNKKLIPLFEDLVAQACTQHVIVARPAWEIDRDGASTIREATMVTAIMRLLERLTVMHPGIYDACRIVVDGHLNLGDVPFKYSAIAKADQTVWQVSCASVLAKAYQMRVMQELHTKHAAYAWDRNNGYGTPAHLIALQEHGVTRYHRKTYRAVRELL